MRGFKRPSTISFVELFFDIHRHQPLTTTTTTTHTLLDTSPMADSVQEHVTAVAGTPPITDASSPFDDFDADVILRSSDNVDFKAFKLFLSFGSPFFKDVFSLPQSAGDGTETKDGRPVIQVSETAEILRVVLSMCYPMGAVDQPALDKLEDVDMLLDAAIKYGVERVEKRAREMLVAPQHLKESALRVFAIACRHRLNEEARAAARATLSGPIPDCSFGAELDLLPATKLFRLLQYHRDCNTAIKGVKANGDPSQWPGLSEYLAHEHHCVLCDSARNFRLRLARLPDTLDKSFNVSLVDRASLELILDEGVWCTVTCGSYSSHIQKPTAQLTRQFADHLLSQMEGAISSVISSIV